MNIQPIAPESYLQELIAEESRAVAKRHNAAGYIAMWPDAVKRVMEKFPNLSPAERTALLATVESSIQLFSARTHMDIHQFAGARGSVARILGGASC